MRDPFPIPPPVWLIRLVKPFSDQLNLHSLPLHAHEVLFAAFLYVFICNYISPPLSTWLFPKSYPRLNPRTRLNWDVHVVSFFQSVLISAMSLWIIFCDEERASWRGRANWPLRIWAYHGAGGLNQSFALGYFLWDLYMCARYMDVFGVGMLAHAVSAVAVFSFGYRPFIYFSSPIFLLYELSSPFLNIHWFCDKLDLTGSIYQAVNGVFLTSTFFGCRIIWGIYSSYLVFSDMYSAYSSGRTQRSTTNLSSTLTVSRLLQIHGDSDLQINAFNPDRHLPPWLPIIYLTSNVVLNSLNVLWFGKMIETIRGRFDPPFGTKGLNETPKKDHKTSEKTDEVVVAAAKDLKESTEMKGVEEDKVKEKLEKKNNSKTAGSVRKARMRAEEALDRPIDGVESEQRVAAASALDGHLDASAKDSPARSVRSRRKA